MTLFLAQRHSPFGHTLQPAHFYHILLSSCSIKAGNYRYAIAEECVQYLLSQQERPLINAALALGDWLVGLRETSRGQRKIIQKMQEALRTLPEVPRGIAAEYGFHCRVLNGNGLLYRAWKVSLSPAGLEIYSVYTPDQPIEIKDKMTHELNFWIKPGETSGHDGHYRQQWIEEVSNPAALISGAFEFAVYAAYFD